MVNGDRQRGLHAASRAHVHTGVTVCEVAGSHLASGGARPGKVRRTDPNSGRKVAEGALFDIGGDIRTRYRSQGFDANAAAIAFKPVLEEARIVRREAVATHRHRGDRLVPEGAILNAWTMAIARIRTHLHAVVAALNHEVAERDLVAEEELIRREQESSACRGNANHWQLAVPEECALKPDVVGRRDREGLAVGCGGVLLVAFHVDDRGRANGLLWHVRQR